MKSWLIQYRKQSGEASFTEYADAKEAMKERLRLDRLNKDYDLEIAVISGESLEGLRKTHTRYFRNEIAAHYQTKSV